MKLKTLEAVSLAAGENNEDAWAATLDSVAWVFDGATGLTDTALTRWKNDASAFVEEANSALLACNTLLEGSLRSVLTELIEHMTHWVQTHQVRPPRSRFELPSAGLILTRLFEGKLEVLSLGDLKCIYATRENTETFGSSPLEELDAVALASMRQLQNEYPSKSFDEIRRMLTPQLQRHRQLMNTAEGYWIISNDRTAAEYAKIYAPQAEIGGKVLLVSDGFYRLIDTFHQYDLESFVSRAQAPSGLHVLGNELRNIEASDPSCREYPRFKPSDDATAVLLEIVAG
ncbi:MAG: hypothetical protein AAFW81_00060 [Pseudomonadota bacterium]